VKRALVIIVAGFLLLAGGVYFFAQRALGSDLVRTQLEQQLSARLGQPVRIGSVRARIYPGIAVDLGEVSIGQPEALHAARIRAFTGIGALFAEQIDIRSIDVINARPGGAPVTFDLSASVLGDRLDVKALTIRGPVTKIDAAGTLTSVSRIEGRFEARSDLLDLNELIAIAGAMAPPPTGRRRNDSATPMHLTVKLASARVRFGTDEFRDLVTTIDARPGRVVLDDLSVHLFGGAFKGRLEADTGDAVPGLRLTGSMSALDVADLLKRTGSAGGVTGRLSGDVSLASRGADGAQLTRNAHGTIAATVVDGTLPHLDMVRTIVLAFGKPAPGGAQGSGTAFTSLGGTFALASSTLRSDNLALRSRDVDADGRVTLAIDTGAVDARADLSLSPELTAQAGTDLRRYAQENGRVILPATVSGTLDRPTVFIDVAAAAKRAITNEMKRRVTDFIGGLFKKKKGGG
jgi:uncharacterized protein involved in outer membrane biogenesis